MSYDQRLHPDLISLQYVEGELGVDVVCHHGSQAVERRWNRSGRPEVQHMRQGTCCGVELEAMDEIPLDTSEQPLSPAIRFAGRQRCPFGIIRGGTDA